MHQISATNGDTDAAAPVEARLPRPPQVTLALPDGWSATEAVKAELVLLAPASDAFRSNITVAFERLSSTHTDDDVVALMTSGLRRQRGVVVTRVDARAIAERHALEQRFVRTLDDVRLYGRQAVVIEPVTQSAVRYLLVITALSDVDAWAELDRALDVLLASLRVDDLGDH